LNSKVTRPDKELKAFARVTLNPGEKKDVELFIKMKDLAYWDETLKNFEVEKDDVALMVGSSSADIKLQKTIVIER
jgi:beta-glucosidase